VEVEGPEAAASHMESDPGARRWGAGGAAGSGDNRRIIAPLRATVPNLTPAGCQGGP